MQRRRLDSINKLHKYIGLVRLIPIQRSIQIKVMEGTNKGILDKEQEIMLLNVHER